MLDVAKLQKLTVGDIAGFERHRRETKKKELIATLKELYGDSVPPDSLSEIERQLKLIPKLEDSDALAVDDISYLVWTSLKKSDPDVTIEQVGNWLDVEKLQEYIGFLFPQTDKVQVKKKAVRKKKKKDN